MKSDAEIDKEFQEYLESLSAGLKSCPFCGAQALRYNTMTGYYIECFNHHRLTTPDWRETDNVWNSRKEGLL